MSNFFPAVVGERSCGRRVPGGTYVEVGLLPPGAVFRGMGRTVEDFLIDPPVVLTAVMDFSERSVAVIQQPGSDDKPIWHVVDVVGERYYPNVADFVEEVRHMGLSRRVQGTLPFNLLTASSRIILVHRKAWVEHYAELREQIDPLSDGPRHRCPRDMNVPESTHQLGQTMCAGIWWDDLDGDTIVPVGGGMFSRAMPEFQYLGRGRPDSIDVEYRPAFFASFPISRLVVVKGEQSDSALTRARASRLRVDEVDE